MLSDKLGIKQVPNSIFKLTSNDEENTHKLRSLVNDVIKPINLSNSSSNQSGGVLNNEKKGKVEIRMKKGIKQNKTKIVNNVGGISGRSNGEGKEETKSTNQSDRTMIDKDLFESKI